METKQLLIMTLIFFIASCNLNSSKEENNNTNPTLIGTWALAGAHTKFQSNGVLEYEVTDFFRVDSTVSVKEFTNDLMYYYTIVNNECSYFEYKAMYQYLNDTLFTYFEDTPMEKRLTGGDKILALTNDTLIMDIYSDNYPTPNSFFHSTHSYVRLNSAINSEQSRYPKCED